VRAATADGPQWFDSNRNRNAFRIARTGCFRGGVPIEPGANIDAIRFRAWVPSEPTTDRPSVRITRVNRIFVLDDDFQPRPLPFTWKGSLPLTLDGTPAELPLY
jgi:hypothetical protein